MKKALITGIRGQDGSYLAEYLLGKGYEVHGLLRGEVDHGDASFWRISGIRERIKFHTCETGNGAEIGNLVSSVMPDEIYHLASNVQPRVIAGDELDIFNVNFLGAVHFLNAIHNHNNKCRLYCAGSSLMFGRVHESPQCEHTPFNPTTPYGIGKVAAFHFLNMYREAYKIFACTGILFNHESPRRDEAFLPRKISKAVANIKCGRQSELSLGNIEIKRDWMHAADAIESMWLMLQSDDPDDYVIGSGQLHSIKEILEIAFEYVGLDWRDYVKLDPNLVRNIEYMNLCADNTKAKLKLGWSPKISFKDMIEEMVRNDLDHG